MCHFWMSLYYEFFEKTLAWYGLILCHAIQVEFPLFTTSGHHRAPDNFSLIYLNSGFELSR